jgi:hypothetical protein
MATYYRKKILLKIVVFFLIMGSIASPDCLFGDDISDNPPDSKTAPSSGVRIIPMDMYLIIDGSSSFNKRKNDVVTWLCDYVVDTLLLEGDTLTIWVAGEKAQQVLSESITGPDIKEQVKQVFQSLNPKGRSADYTTALREAAHLEASADQGHIKYTLLVMAGYASFPMKPETARLLRYSRVQNFTGWKAVAAALGIERDVRKAAASLMN